MPKVFNNLQSLVNDVESNKRNEWLYINPKEWLNNPEGTRFFYIEEEYIWDLEEEGLYVENEAGDSIPKEFENEGLEIWIESQTFDDIIKYAKNKNLNVTLNELILAINYYLEYDAFKEN
ncbi:MULTISPECIES: hypothetical protein [Flavobacterium]|uniref:DUF7716 domain-containing protein n=1 Tax=Flavobacterium endoglycinae TaxID=2816357 RepID=A0ABX7QKH0_9FLAO|nr:MULTISPECIES: hypothetical protein [Flavobacterium]QSW91150.1 hypothetical protein J0383_10170 [Flavobacterium endoglycinae]